MKRFYVAVLISFASLLNTGCSPDDAKAAKAAAAALKLQIETALSAYSNLILRAGLESQEQTQKDIKTFMAQTRADAKAGKWEEVAEMARKQFTAYDLATTVRGRFRENTADITTAVAYIDAAAADYEAAWPFGSGDFVCLSESVYLLTHSLREVARSFDAPPMAGKPGGKRYKPLVVESDLATKNYVALLNSGDEVAAAVALQGYRELMLAEKKANADVQAAFVRAAQSAADLYSAIEAVKNVTVTEVLRLIQRYAPGLTSIDDSIDGEAIAKKAGVVLGKVSQSSWLDRFATKPLSGPKCKSN
jgi:hypothetical protein